MATTLQRTVPWRDLVQYRHWEIFKETEFAGLGNVYGHVWLEFVDAVGLWLDAQVALNANIFA